MQSLDAHADSDWVGFGQHWDAWTTAACTGRLLPTVVFARASRLWEHAPELIALLGADPACVPRALCTEREQPPWPATPSAALATLRKLNTTFAQLRRKQAEFGEFRVVRGACAVTPLDPT